jgi:predicted membrane protein
VTVFGDIELDLRQAAVPAELEIKAVAPFGDIEIVVPDGVAVELTGISVFGRKKTDVRRSASREWAPVVKVQAVTVFGSVLVRS